MQSKIFVYDPTANDPLSKVRGIGRYLQILHENFDGEWTFISDLSSMIHDPSSIFINPFFNFLRPPLTMRRVAKKQTAVIHDLIPFKYPSHFPLGVKGKINFLLNQFALNNYDTIVTDSEASKKDIIEILHIEPDKVRVVYPCLPKIFNQVVSSKQKVVRNMQNLPDYQLPTTDYCLYVGDATWNKNLVNLAKAIKEINITCVFVGKVFESIINHPSSIIQNNPWNRELNEFIREIGNDKRFIFPGFVEDNQLIALYQKAPGKKNYHGNPQQFFETACFLHALWRRALCLRVQ